MLLLPKNWRSRPQKRCRGRPARRLTLNAPDGRLAIRRLMALADLRAAVVARDVVRGRAPDTERACWLAGFLVGATVEGEGSPGELVALLRPACVAFLRELGLDGTVSRGFKSHAARRVAYLHGLPPATLARV